MKNLEIRYRFNRWYQRANKVQRTILYVAMIAFAYALPVLSIPLVKTTGSDWVTVLFYPIGMYVMMAIGLNIVVGKSGLLDLGYVAFFAVGAYTTAVFGIHTSLNLWEIIPFAIVLAMFAGLLLGVPTLRLRGDYLAIVTMGFGEIIRLVARNVDYFGGSRGLDNIPRPPAVFGIEFGLDAKPYYWALLTVIIIATTGFLKVSRRRPGRAWEAIRQDEDVAALMGVNTLKYKLWAFCAGAAISGAGGAIYASYARAISPESFNLNFSIMVLACVVFGGIGNIWGVMLGAILLTYVPEKIRFLSDTRLLIFGVSMVVIMNLRPGGLLPKVKYETVEAKK